MFEILLSHKAKSCFIIFNPLDLFIYSFCYTIFSISSFETLFFFDFDYQTFEYFKDFKSLLEKFMDLFHYFKRLYGELFK